MQAINYLKQDNLYLIENKTTKKVFVATNKEGTSRVCEHDHNKEDFVKYYTSRKTGELCNSCDKKKSINVRFENVSVSYQQRLQRVAETFFPCFDTKDFLFFLEVNENAGKWCIQNATKDMADSDGVLIIDVFPIIRQNFAADVIKLYKSDYMFQITDPEIFEKYMMVREEVEKRVQNVDWLTGDQILQLLESGQKNVAISNVPIYTRELLHELNSVMKIEAGKTDQKYTQAAKQLSITYAAQLKKYFQAVSMLRNIQTFLKNNGVLKFSQMFSPLGGTIQLNSKVFKMMENICASSSGYHAISQKLGKALQLTPAQLSLLMSLGVSDIDSIVPLATQIKSGKIHESQTLFQDPLIKVSYERFFDDGGNSFVETYIRLNIFEIYAHLNLFDSQGVLLGKHYSEPTIYQRIKVEVAN